MKRQWPEHQDAVLARLYAGTTELTVDQLLLDPGELCRVTEMLNNECSVTRSPEDVGHRMLTLRKKGLLARKVRT